ALTNSVGSVVERYEYSDYGAPSFLTAGGAAQAKSAVGNSYCFTGRQYDEETRLYYYRTRYFDALLGRFTARDTIGVWGDASELGNAYSYAGNSPTSKSDPFGMSFMSCWNACDSALGNDLDHCADVWRNDHSDSANDDWDKCQDAACDKYEGCAWGCLWPSNWIAADHGADGGGGRAFLSVIGEASPPGVTGGSSCGSQVSLGGRSFYNSPISSQNYNGARMDSSLFSSGASWNARRNTVRGGLPVSDKLYVAGDGIEGVQVGLKKKPGGDTGPPPKPPCYWVGVNGIAVKVCP